MSHVEIRIDGAVVYQTKEPIHVYDENRITDFSDAAKHFDSIRTRPTEVFAVTTLNGANQPIKTHWITTGLLDSNQVHPREVFRAAIEDGAASIICGHNHPSGTLDASPEDLAITRRLIKAGEIIGIRLLDHIVVTEFGNLSFRDKGFI